MPKHCPVTGEPLVSCSCGACEDLDADVTGWQADQPDGDEAA